VLSFKINLWPIPTFKKRKEIQCWIFDDETYEENITAVKLVSAVEILFSVPLLLLS